MALGPGLVHGYIQATKALDGLVDEIVHTVLASDITRTNSASAPRARSSVAQFSGGCLPSAVASTGDYDERTFVRSRESGGAADAGNRDRDFAGDWYRPFNFGGVVHGDN